MGGWTSRECGPFFGLLRGDIERRQLSGVNHLHGQTGEGEAGDLHGDTDGSGFRHDRLCDMQAVEEFKGWAMVPSARRDVAGGEGIAGEGNGTRFEHLPGISERRAAVGGLNPERFSNLGFGIPSEVQFRDGEALAEREWTAGARGFLIFRKTGGRRGLFRAGPVRFKTLFVRHSSPPLVPLSSTPCGASRIPCGPQRGGILTGGDRVARRSLQVVKDWSDGLVGVGPRPIPHHPHCLVEMRMRDATPLHNAGRGTAHSSRTAVVCTRPDPLSRS